jgi:hypothetical protein
MHDPYTCEIINLLTCPCCCSHVEHCGCLNLDCIDSQIMTCACSNEIAGDGAVPHPCVGSSRRVMVSRRELQHEKLLEAVQNMTPDVVICDEISDLKVGALERGSALVLHPCSLPPS